ncbi:PREDICTED: zinc finger [Prunus dulcis]|uniref:PREDICTED: zinc finger n=1 Tax=Prunus dulcis TaxID=3755 RepID=A0A5E4GK44_PRUDU|nr:zinc finger BED domain-containing protein RICESLEEPER 2-like [Prunus dulcis]VVA39951.1 PREDICTED: zinc finger [Prunus dulcis]
MKAKFDKYWEEFPTVFCFATIMDPRFKVFAIGEWLNMTGIDQLTIDSKLLALKTLLFQFFDVYKRSVMSYVGQNVQSANVTSSTLSQTPGSVVVPIMQDFSMQCLKRAKLSSSSSSTTKSELQVYLDLPTIDVADDNQFSFLGWWKKNQSLYPIVSLMARDLLTIPASTIASESCFSAGGKVLSDKWTSLSPNTIEALICLKDWALANSRMQDPAQDEQRAEELMNTRASRSDWMAARETVESESENETIES